jgi:WD40 repeat protein
VLYDLNKHSVSTIPVVNSGGGREEVRGLAFHPRQPLVAAKCSDGAVRVYTVPDGKLACAMKQGEARLGRMAFSPDGKYIASCFEATGHVDLWNTEKTSLVLSLVGVGKRGKDFLAWTPEGYYIATPYAESLLTAKQGDKDVPADEFKALFHRPEMVAAKLAGKDVPSPSELKKEKTSPKGQD